jgi:hypothetical protein
MSFVLSPATISEKNESDILLRVLERSKGNQQKARASMAFFTEEISC